MIDYIFDISIGFVLGVLISILGYIDVLAKRNKEPFLMYLLHILCSVLPPILDSFIEIDFSKIFYITFYLTFLTGTIFIVIFIYYTVYKRLILRFQNLDETFKFTYLEFLFSGYKNFIETLDREYSIAVSNYKSNIDFAITSASHSDASKFVRSIYTTTGYNDSDAYITYVLQSFIDSFIGNRNARFTLRKLDENDQMVTKLTTRSDKAPSPIPIDKTNLICKSMDLGIPLLYSKHKKFHYSTGTTNVPNLYSEYVSYCLISSNGKPQYSVCLEVRKESAKVIRTLVNTMFFSIVCEAISYQLKINSDVS